MINSENKCILEETEQGRRSRKESRKKGELGGGRGRDCFITEDT